MGKILWRTKKGKQKHSDVILKMKYNVCKLTRPKKLGVHVHRMCVLNCFGIFYI